LTCLIYALRQLDNADGDAADDFGKIPEDVDMAFVSAYRPEYERLLMLHKNMQLGVASYRQGTLSDAGDVEDLGEALQQALRRTYVFIGCAVRLKYPLDAGAINALAHFGFKVKPLQPAPSVFYVIRRAALAMPALVFLAVIAAQLFGLEFPQDGMTPQQTAVVWALSSLLVHGCAAWAAYKLRAHLKITSEWNGTPVQIVSAGVVGGVAGLAALLPLVALFGYEPFTMKAALKAVPWVALPATTGAFTAYFLDTSIEVARGRRLREAAIQGFVTALVTYLVLTVLPDPHISGTMEYFVIFVTLLIGGSLGFFLPHCHRELERSLSGEAQSRIDDFRWEATRIFGDEAKANDWLNQPNASLGGMTPIDAARSGGGGDRVRAVLHAMWEAGHPKPARKKRPEPSRANGRNGREVRSGIAARSDPAPSEPATSAVSAPAGVN
jgi:hypothetical protein